MNKLLLTLYILLISANSFAAVLSQDRLPTGNGTASNWTVSGCSNAWDCVDDPIGTPDDLTTYLYIQNSGANRRFTFANFDITSTSIISLTVTARCTRTAYGAVSVRGQILTTGVGGISSTATEQGVGTGWAYYTFTWTTNPATQSPPTAWTEADIEGTGPSPLTEFGMTTLGLDSGEDIKCTQVYATVNYNGVVGSPSKTIKFNAEDF